jgi:hypothetical protein
MVGLNKELVFWNTPADATNPPPSPAFTFWSAGAMTLGLGGASNRLTGLLASIDGSLGKSVVEGLLPFKAGANLTIATPETRARP